MISLFITFFEIRIYHFSYFQPMYISLFLTFDNFIKSIITIYICHYFYICFYFILIGQLYTWSESISQPFRPVDNYENPFSISRIFLSFAKKKNQKDDFRLKIKKYTRCT